MDKTVLKSFFITRGLCKDCGYLDNYLDLLESARLEKYVPVSTQRHHLIPVSYYKRIFNLGTRYEAERAATADPLNELIVLKYSDHLLAHAYLALAADVNWFKYANYNVFGKFIQQGLSDELLQFIQSPEFQAGYEAAQPLRKLTEEQKRKIAETRKARQAAGLYSPKPKSAEARERIGAAKRGKVYITNPDKTATKLVSKDEVDSYLALGWTLGNIFTSTGNLGKKQSEETVKKRMQSMQGKNDISVFCVELERTFSSIKQAASELGLKYPSNISNCLTGKSKTAGGYHWRYSE